MTNYVWTISPGGTIISGQGTREIEVTWNTPGAQYVTAIFVNPSGCTPTVPTVYPVTVAAMPGTAGSISGTSNVCFGSIIQKIYDDTGNFILGAEATAERMRMQLISTGKIGIVDSGVAVDYDYDFPDAHRAALTATADRWSSIGTSVPVSDITGWQDQIEEDTGVRPTRAVCSKKTFNYLVNNQGIRKDMQPLADTSHIVTPSEIYQYFLNKCGVEIYVNSKTYKTEVKGTTAKYFPDDVFSLLPAGTLGNTYYGTTPEESDLMSGAAQADVQIVNTGVAVTTVKNVHPVNVQTIVSAILLPSWENRDQCFIAEVN